MQKIMPGQSESADSKQISRSSNGLCRSAPSPRNSALRFADPIKFMSAGAKTGVFSGIFMFILVLPGYESYPGGPPDSGPRVIISGSAWVPNLMTLSSFSNSVCQALILVRSAGGKVIAEAVVDGILSGDGTGERVGENDSLAEVGVGVGVLGD